MQLKWICGIDYIINFQSMQKHLWDYMRNHLGLNWLLCMFKDTQKLFPHILDHESARWENNNLTWSLPYYVDPKNCIIVNVA